MLDLLFNPWVIFIILICVIIGNVAALKHTDKIKFGQQQSDKKSDIEKLIELDKKHRDKEDNQK